MEKIIIGLVGPIASGKGVTKRYIEEKYQGKDCRFSSILRDILNRVNLPTSRENLQKISTVLRQSFGEDLLAKAISIDASRLEAGIVVIDGVRRMADIKYLRELPNFFLVKIDAEHTERHQRVIRRNENPGDDKKSFEDFVKDHEAEADREVPIVMEEAKYSIHNNGTIEELYTQIDNLIDELKKHIV